LNGKKSVRVGLAKCRLDVLGGAFDDGLECGPDFLEEENVPPAGMRKPAPHKPYYFSPNSVDKDNFCQKFINEQS
jgi:hypothetical protein